MSLFVLHLSLMLFWVTLIGREWSDFLVGFLLGGAIVTFGDNFWYASHEDNESDSPGFRIYPVFLFKKREYLQTELWIMRHFLTRFPMHLALLVFFLGELMKSTFEVMERVIRYRSGIESGIVEVELACTRDFEVILLSALITLSPGTLTVDEHIDPETNIRYLYVHVLHMPDHKTAIISVKKLEARILRTLYGKNHKGIQEEN